MSIPESHNILRLNPGVLSILSQHGVKLPSDRSHLDANDIQAIFNNVINIMNESQDVRTIEECKKFLQCNESVKNNLNIKTTAIAHKNLRVEETSKKSGDEEEKLEYLSALGEFFKDSTLEEEDIATILTDLQSLSGESLGKFYDAARRLKNADVSECQIADILVELKDHPARVVEKFSNMLVSVKEFSKVSEHAIGAILVQLKGLPSDKLEKLCEIFCLLGSQFKEEGEIVNKVLKLKDFSMEGLESLHELTKKLGGLGVDGDILGSTSKRLIDSPVTIFKELYDELAPLDDAGLSGDEICFILQNLEEAPVDSIKKLCGVAVRLKGKGVSADEIGAVLTGIKDAPLEKLDKLCDMVIHLKGAGLTLQEMDWILTKPKEAPLEKLDKLCDMVIRLKGAGVTLQERNWILRNLEDAPLEKLDKLCDMVIRLKGAGVTLQEMDWILTKLKDAPLEKLDKLSDIAIRFKGTGLTSQEIVFVLEKMKEAPLEKLDKLCDMVIRLKGAGLTPQDMVFVLEEMKDAPLEKLDKLCDMVIRLKGAGLTPQDMVFVLEEIKDAPLENLDKLCDIVIHLKETGLTPQETASCWSGDIKNASEGILNKLCDLSIYSKETGASKEDVLGILVLSDGENLNNFFDGVIRLKGAGLTVHEISCILLSNIINAQEVNLDKLFDVVFSLKGAGLVGEEMYYILTSIKDAPLENLDKLCGVAVRLKEAGLVGEEMGAILLKIKETSKEKFNKLCDLFLSLKEVDLSKEGADYIVENLNENNENPKQFIACIELFKEKSSNKLDQFMFKALFDIFNKKGEKEVEHLFLCKTAEELSSFTALTNIQGKLLEELLFKLPFPQAIQFIKDSSPEMFKGFPNKPQNTSIAQTILYYLCADKANNGRQRAFCLSFLKKQILVASEGLIELNELPSAAKNALVKEILLKSEKPALIQVAKTLMESIIDPLQQQVPPFKIEDWRRQIEDFNQALGEANISEKEQSPLKQILAELTLREEGTYGVEQLVSILNSIKHIPNDKISAALLSLVLSPEASSKEIEEALHPCHVLAVIPDLTPSHSSLDPERVDVGMISKHLAMIDASFNKEAVSHFLNEVLATCKDQEEIFSKASSLAKEHQILLKEELILPVMTYLLPLCKEEAEFLPILTLAKDHENNIPAPLLEKAISQIRFVDPRGFFEKLPKEIIDKLSQTVEIKSISSAIFYYVVAKETKNEELTRRTISYLEKEVETSIHLEEFLGSQELLQLLSPQERVDLAKQIFIFSEDDAMLTLAQDIRGIQDPNYLQAWKQELDWIEVATKDPVGIRKLKELAFEQAPEVYDPEELKALADNILVLPESLREAILGELDIPKSDSGAVKINAYFDLCYVFEKISPKLLQDYLRVLFPNEETKQYAVGHLIELANSDENSKKACLIAVSILLKTSQHLQPKQVQQLDLDYSVSSLDEETKNNIVATLSAQNDQEILEAIKTMATEEQLPAIDQRISETKRLDSVLDEALVSPNLAIAFKDLIRSNLVDYLSYSDEDLKAICGSLLKLSEDLRTHVLQITVPQYKDEIEKAFRPENILFSLPKDSKLVQIYLKDLSLSSYLQEIAILLEERHNKIGTPVEKVLETATAIIMCDNQELRRGLRDIIKTPPFSDQDLSLLEGLRAQVQDAILKNMENANISLEDANSIQDKLINHAISLLPEDLISYNQVIEMDKRHSIRLLDDIGQVPISADVLSKNMQNLIDSKRSRVFFETKLLVRTYPTLSGQEILSIITNIPERGQQHEACEIVTRLRAEGRLLPDTLHGVDLFVKAIKELLFTTEANNIDIVKIGNCIEGKILPELCLDPKAIEELTLVDIDQGKLPPKLEKARAICQELRKVPFYQGYTWIFDRLENLQQPKNCYRIYAVIKEAQKQEILPSEDIVEPISVEMVENLDGLQKDKDPGLEITKDTVLALYATLKDHLHGEEGVKEVLTVLDPEGTMYPFIDTPEKTFEKLSSIMESILKNEMNPDLQAVFRFVAKEPCLLLEGKVLSPQDESFLQVLAKLRSEKTQYSLDIQKFQEKAKASSVRAQDLPLTVNSDTPITLFTDLKKKVLGLSMEAQGKIKNQLIKVLKEGGQVSYPPNTSIEILLDRLVVRFKDNDYADKLMHSVPKDPNASVDQDLYRLYTIFDYIQKLPSLEEGKDLLSKQDDYLIFTFANIQQCSTGQSEGIAQVYALTQNNVLTLQSQENGEKFIDKFIQDSLEGSINTTLQDILPRIAFNQQQVHQSQYLKNMISDWIGLTYSLTFDPYSEVLDNSLVLKNKKELLQAFYKKFPNPIELCKNLQGHINSTPNTYSMFSPLLKDNPIFWDEEGKITLQGCIYLLNNFHYLNVENSLLGK